jgi:nitroimidazol reductase NimA-like FMN-containing flavoprotein (pyridoxamine 5'-phosphate oxidase superfamily)
MMNVNDPQVQRFIGQARVARIGTLSSTGKPSITPIYFVCVRGHIWVATASWTLAARQVAADPRISVLFQIERISDDRRVLRVTGSAVVRTDAGTLRQGNLRMALKYLLTPGALRNRWANRHLLRGVRRYHAQNDEKGPPCIIDVTPQRVEFLG